MATGDHDHLVEQRGQLLRELADIGDLRQGSLRAQYRKCGKPNCHGAGETERREAKLAVVWSAQTTDKEGRPVRDPGSATYNAAIETIASRDTDAEPAPFARRVLRETERRGFDTAQRRVILGDGAPWIWNFADEHFPDAIQIADIFHAKGHPFEVAKAIHGVGSEVGERWASSGARNSTRAASTKSSPPCTAMPKPARRPERTPSTFPPTART